MAQRIVKLLYNKRNRRVAAGVLFSGLLLKNSLQHICPDDLLFPFYAYPTNEACIVDAIGLLNKCKVDMGLTRDVLPVKPFVSATMEVCSAGFAAFGLGQSQIGIPRSFLCTSVEQLSHFNLLYGASSNIKRPKGVTFEKVDENEIKLMESHLMSDDAKCFAIARHLSYFKRNWALYQALLPSSFVIVGYLLMFHSPKLLFASSSRPVSLLSILGVSLVGALAAYLTCKLAKAALARKISVQADVDAARISPEYAMGGVEMYEKLAETNRALRILFGRKGEALYTLDGDQTNWLFQMFNPNAPNFSNRREYLQEIMQSQSFSASASNVLSNV